MSKRLETIEVHLVEHDRLCAIPFFEATGEDDMYLRSYRKQLLEDIRPLLAVAKAAEAYRRDGGYEAMKSIFDALDALETEQA